MGRRVGAPGGNTRLEAVSRRLAAATRRLGAGRPAASRCMDLLRRAGALWTSGRESDVALRSRPRVVAQVDVGTLWQAHPHGRRIPQYRGTTPDNQNRRLSTLIEAPTRGDAGAVQAPLARHSKGGSIVTNYLCSLRRSRRR